MTVIINYMIQEPKGHAFHACMKKYDPRAKNFGKG